MQHRRVPRMFGEELKESLSTEFVFWFSGHGLARIGYPPNPENTDCYANAVGGGGCTWHPSIEAAEAYAEQKVRDFWATLGQRIGASLA